MFEKCEFCEKWDFVNVNFVKSEIFKMWFFGYIEDFCPSVYGCCSCISRKVWDSKSYLIFWSKKTLFKSHLIWSPSSRTEQSWKGIFSSHSPTWVCQSLGDIHVIICRCHWVRKPCDWHECSLNAFSFSLRCYCYSSSGWGSYIRWQAKLTPKAEEEAITSHAKS